VAWELSWNRRRHRTLTASGAVSTAGRLVADRVERSKIAVTAARHCFRRIATTPISGTAVDRKGPGGRQRATRSTSTQRIEFAHAQASTRSWSQRDRPRTIARGPSARHPSRLIAREANQPPGASGRGWRARLREDMAVARRPSVSRRSCALQAQPEGSSRHHGALSTRHFHRVEEDQSNGHSCRQPPPGQAPAFRRTQSSGKNAITPVRAQHQPGHRSRLKSKAASHTEFPKQHSPDRQPSGRTAGMRP